MNTENFVKKAKEIHGSKYDYSKSQYQKARIKLEIICPIHGSFWQNPELHYIYGCRQCGFEQGGKNTLEKANRSFVEKAKKRHGNKYNYSLVKYAGWAVKIKIICPIHGVFEQLPCSHHRGMGCIKCSTEINAIKAKKSITEFVENAKQVHDSYYSYTNSIYISSKTKLEIICPIHGPFQQIPYVHLAGKGCPKCSVSHSKNEAKITKFLKENQINFEREFCIKNYNKYKKFDFYLPDYDLYIEYDGIFHYKPLLGAKRLKEQQERDNKTNKWCKDNNINLVRFRNYEEFKNWFYAKCAAMANQQERVAA